MNLNSFSNDVWFQVMICLEPIDCFNLALCHKKFEDLHKAVIQRQK